MGCVFSWFSEVETLECVEDFQYILQENQKVVVNFSAPWCKNCQKLWPAYQRYSMKYRENILFCMVNVDEGEDILKLADDFDWVPAIQFYQDGKRISQIQGANKKQLKKELDVFAKYRMGEPTVDNLKDFDSYKQYIDQNHKVILEFTSKGAQKNHQHIEAYLDDLLKDAENKARLSVRRKSMSQGVEAEPVRLARVNISKNKEAKQIMEDCGCEHIPAIKFFRAAACSDSMEAPMMALDRQLFLHDIQMKVAKLKLGALPE